MLKGIPICVCLFLCLYNTIIRCNDVFGMYTEKLQQHPRYLKEFFPLLPKYDKSEEENSCLTEVKRERRVCHHGNFKRSSHVIRLKPGNDFKNKLFIKKPFVGIRKITHKKAKRNVSREQCNKFLGNRKIRDETRNLKSTTTTNQIATTNPKVSKFPHISITKSSNTTRKVKKRRENKESYMLSKKDVGVTKRSDGVDDNILDNDEIDMLSSKLSQFGELLKHDHKVSKLAARSSSSTPKQINLITKDSLNDFTIKILDDSEFNECGKEFTKRETKPQQKHKHVKSVITKILIIPVERQVEDDGDVPEDINTLKHSKHTTIKPNAILHTRTITASTSGKLHKENTRVAKATSLKSTSLKTNKETLNNKFSTKSLIATTCNSDLPISKSLSAYPMNVSNTSKV